MGKVIGIDWARPIRASPSWKAAQPKVIANSEGSNTTPSVVAFTEDGERLIGVSRARQAVTNPSIPIYAVKRLIGRSFDDPITKKDADLVPYKIVQGPERRRLDPRPRQEIRAVGNLRLRAAKDEADGGGLSRRDR